MNGITDSVDMNLSKFWEILEIGRASWCIMPYNAYIPVLAPLIVHSHLLFQTLNFLVCKMDIPTRTKFALSETRKLEKLYEMAVFKILDSNHNEGQ